MEQQSLLLDINISLLPIPLPRTHAWNCLLLSYLDPYLDLYPLHVQPASVPTHIPRRHSHITVFPQYRCTHVHPIHPQLQLFKTIVQKRKQRGKAKSAISRLSSIEDTESHLCKILVILLSPWEAKPGKLSSLSSQAGLHSMWKFRSVASPNRNAKLPWSTAGKLRQIVVCKQARVMDPVGFCRHW